jgi:hypothetical protein
MGWRDLAFKLKSKLHDLLLPWGAPTIEQAGVPAETYVSSIKAYCAQHDTATEKLQLDGRYVAPTTIPDDVGRIVDLLVYRPERFDCEDYALTFKVTETRVQHKTISPEIAVAVREVACL